MMDALKNLLANPPIEALAFWFCAVMSVGAALFAAFSTRIVRAAYSLFFTLLGLAGFYILLGADFLGIVQVVVYIGGILALILFGVLLTNRAPSEQLAESRKWTIVAAFAAIGLFLLLTACLLHVNWSLIANPNPPAIEPTTRPLGMALLGKYLLPFEFISITLLAALVGALYLARRQDD
ncbi:MAG: NADH-quinone oxidoreductase subunit J [Candidatus Sumerlaeota bacterium]|nr:NADH-quinone oxidoreductase subunit J [Candidatus Sumerlaeota bacterium]